MVNGQKVEPTSAVEGGEPDAPVRPSPQVIAAVRGSLQAVAQRPVALAEAFYHELFAMEPSLRAMFAPDMTGQMQKMTETLVGAIAALDAPDLADLEKTLRALGAVHRTRFGVEEAHYGYIGHALTRAVRDVAGPAFSGSLSSSWIALYQWVAAHMIAGARDAVRLPAQRRVEVAPLERPLEVPGPRRPVRDKLAPSFRTGAALAE